MLLSRRAARVLLAAAISILAPVSHAAPEISVHRWDAPANIDAFSTWLGSPVTIASVFHGRGSWSAIEGQDSQLSAWSQWVRNQQGRNLAIAIGMFPSGGSLSSCAAGSYDSHWTRLADNLANHGLHWAYLRLGWAMDGGWDPWGALPGSGREASYAGCFRRIVQVMRQAQPANQWKFVLSTATNWNSTSYLAAIWPGDAYVDLLAINFYDHSYAPNTYPYPSSCDANCRATRQQNAWNSNSPKLYMMRDFAIAHGKKMAFAEWGVLIRPDGHGGGDNPDFIRKMHEFIADPANNVAFHSYFNVSIPSDIDARLTNAAAGDNPSGATRLPNSASTYQQLFGPPSLQDVTFTAPTAGATISGSFSGSSGCQVTGTGIAQVVFFMDNTQLNTDTSAPWQCTLDTRNFANGTHTLRAVAYNSAGASTTVTRTVNVQNVSGPTGVTFTAPATGATISGSFSASNACQVSGTGIAQVVFFMDNTQLNTDNSAPWQCTLDTRNFANGTHTLRAVAYNSAGASATVTRTVNVQNSGPTGVTFSAPAAGATISGSFSGSSGCQVSGTGIVQVVFFMDNTQLNTDTLAPWQCMLDTRAFANGTHTLRAVAYNSAGASTAATRTVNVQNGGVGGTPGTPSISSVLGAISHGSSVTIAGTSFGTKSHAGPMLWDDFDSGTNGSAVAGPSGGTQPLIHQGNLASYSQWKRGGGGDISSRSIVFSNSSPKANSSRHARATFSSNSYWGLNLNVPYNQFTTGNELYISFYYRFTKTGAAFGRQTKAWIAYPPSGGDKAYWTNSFGTCQSGDYWRTHATEPVEERSLNPNLSATGIDGEWVRFVSYLKQSGAGVANGAWHQAAWRPSLGTPAKHAVTLNNYKMRNTSENWVEWTFGGAYYSMCSSANTATIDVDDFYMDNTQARVEVCNAPTYSASTKCELQIPTAWSDTSITASLKKGYLAAGTAYVYVINAAGSINAAGFPVTVVP